VTASDRSWQAGCQMWCNPDEAYHATLCYTSPEDRQNQNKCDAVSDGFTDKGRTKSGNNILFTEFFMSL